MQSLQKILPKYTIALGVIFLITIIYLITRGNTVSVEVHPVRKMELARAVYATGYVDADAMADLSSELSGTVGFVGALAGEWVNKGSTILEFDERQLQLASEEAGAAYAEQRSETEDLRIKRERSSNLLQAGAISRQDLEEAEKEYFQAKKLLRQRELQLKSRQNDLRKKIVRSPINGVWTLQNAKAGDYIAANTLVARVVDTTSYMINVEVDELDVLRLKTGQRAAIALDALPEKRFSARVSRVVPQTDKITKTSRVYIKLDEHVEGIQIGMTATANIIYNVRNGVLLVPVSSVFEEAGSDYVWKIVNRKLQKQKIARGASDVRYIEILEGLAEGDSVVVTPEERFREGMDTKIDAEKKE